MTFDLSQFMTDNAAIVSAIFGGAGVKLLDKMLSKRSQDFSEATQLREELTEQLNLVRAEVAKKIVEADTWREKYWNQVEEDILLKTEVETLKREVETLKRQVLAIGRASGSIN